MPRWLATLVTVLLATTAGIALWPPVASAASDAPVAAAAAAFLATLPADLRGKAQRPLDDAERTQWAFVPGRYAGVELGALDATQEQAAHALLQAMLSTAGYQKVTAIVALEDVLQALESAAGLAASHRDPDRYSLLVLGDPGPAGTFTVRFQGHHVSLQVGLVAGRVAHTTPRFLGSNPYELPTGPERGRRVLGAEEDLARALLWLLDADQLAKAVIAETAPADIVLGPGVAPSALGPRRGVAWRELDPTQRALLWRLLEEHARVLTPDVATAELARIRAEGLDELSFAWAGSRERGQGHYYRIHGVHFAVEYDNTQNGANHVHTVWRDFARDHGGDALARHLREQHGR